MERLIKGDVVVLPFPFTDLSDSKRRPALVLANLPGDDIILCQITSKSKHDFYSIKIANEDFESGSLKIESNIRPNKIFTADESIILYKIGTLKNQKKKEVLDSLIKIFS